MNARLATRFGLPGALLLAAMLSACGSAPATPARTPRAMAERTPPRVLAERDPPDEVRAFEKQQRERALAAEQQGALAEAASAWEVLALLKPGEYDGRLAAVQKRIGSLASDYLDRAKQELKQGDLPLSEQLYLSALALQPRNKEAADALRTIERARIRQEHLLKPGRVVSPPADTSNKRTPAGPPVAPPNPLLMEQASNLAAQGDVDEAVELMAGRFKAAPGDVAARDLLAELHYKKAQGLQFSDAAAAQAAAKRCLAVSPKHAGCSALLQVLAGPQRAQPGSLRR